ncbi:MAG: hypothetical protein K2X93_27890 [Candidatus Obscuribacterales bacterium]|nr:hypothetical protein [Candidatus Obscuribacterales bacterium]
MYSFIVRALINGVFLAFILPAVAPGAVFHGNFWPEAVVAGVLFAVSVCILDVLLFFFGVLTLGIGFLLRYLLWFIVPALQILAMAHWFPQYLTIGLGGALIGGFVLLIVNALTGSTPKGDAR